MGKDRNRMDLVWMGAKIIIGGAVALFLLSTLLDLAFGWWFTVEEKSATVVELFGKFRSIRFKGLNFKPPWFWKIAGEVSLQLQDIQTTVASITKDTVPVRAKVKVQFRVRGDAESVYLWHYNMDDPTSQISSWFDRAVLNFIAHSTVTELFENTDRLAEAVGENLGTLLASEAGAEVVKVVVEEIELDEQVQDAMAKVKASERLLEAARNQAASAKVTTIAAAEAEAEAKRLQGEGIAMLRLAVARGMKDSIELTKEAGLGTSEAQLMMLFTMLTDMQEKVGSNARTVLMVPAGAGALQHTLGDLQSLMLTDHLNSGGALPGATTTEEETDAA